jgi:hypothetical protein
VFEFVDGPDHGGLFAADRLDELALTEWAEPAQGEQDGEVAVLHAERAQCFGEGGRCAPVRHPQEQRDVVCHVAQYSSDGDSFRWNFSAATTCSGTWPGRWRGPRAGRVGRRC